LSDEIRAEFVVIGNGVALGQKRLPGGRVERDQIGWELVEFDRRRMQILVPNDSHAQQYGNSCGARKTGNPTIHGGVLVGGRELRCGMN
jgi:hypothetical protein